MKCRLISLYVPLSFSIYNIIVFNISSVLNIFSVYVWKHISVLWLWLTPHHLIISDSAFVIKYNLENSRGGVSTNYHIVLLTLFFPPSWRSRITSFIISFLFWEIPLAVFRIGLLATNSLSFYSSENVLISPSVLKDTSSGYRIRGGPLLSFSTEYCATFFWPLGFLMKNL